jgi:hypothetical protein
LTDRVSMTPRLRPRRNSQGEVRAPVALTMATSTGRGDAVTKLIMSVRCWNRLPGVERSDDNKTHGGRGEDHPGLMAL